MSIQSRPVIFNRVTTVVVTATVALSGLLYFVHPAPPPNGLSGRYYSSLDCSGEPILERVDTVVNTSTIASTPEVEKHSVFCIEWTGSLVIRQDGVYPFATKSDDGTWLWIGNDLVIDNGGSHGVANVSAHVALRRGLYPFRVRYMQNGGGYFLLIGQTGASGTMTHPAPLVVEQTSYARYRLRELWPLGVVAIWYGAFLLLGVKATRRVAGSVPILAELAQAWSDRWIRAIVAFGVLACVAHIGYGLPAVPSFSEDELEPLDVLFASHTGFRDWNLRWPPLHAFLMAGMLQPFVWAEKMYGLSLSDEAVTTCLFIASRGLSTLLTASTLLLTFDGTRMLAGRRAACFAAALLACAPILVFFGSFSNLESAHLFWVSATFWVWLKLMERRNLYWFAAFGVAVGFSVASKDQSYGYYVAAPFALVALIVQERRQRGLPGLPGALIDRRLAVVAVVAFCAFALGHALPWRFDRFVDRLAVMTGPASAPFRMFRPTLDGHVAMLSATARLLVWAAGVPLVLAALGGVFELVRRGRGGLVLAMSTPLVTYYACFLVVILYVYDRFLIAWLPIAAASGGVFLASVERWRVRGLPTGRIVAALVLSAGVLNAIAVNVVFFRDPRSATLDWLRTHVPCGSSVGVTFSGDYIPPLDCFDMWPLRPGNVDSLVRRPQYLVLNEAYAKRFMPTPSGSVFLARLFSGELGYDRVARFESTPPLWAPLYWEPRFWNRREDVETTSDKPLHAIEVWQCIRSSCDSPIAQ